MADKRNDADLPQRDAGGRRHASRPHITGRSFAGTSRASSQREQAASHRGEGQRHKLDGGVARTDARSEPPTDES